MARRNRVYLDPDPEQPEPTPSATGTDSEDNPQALKRSDWLTSADIQAVARSSTEEWIEYGRLPETSEREARWRVNEMRREGFAGVRLVRNEQGQARAWVPLDGGINLELSNEARRLCRVFVGNLMADPPAPQVFPATTDEEDRDAGDVAERALNDLQSEQRLNTPTKVRDALDTGCTYGSGYIVYAVDQTAGGRVVRTMQASPLATDPAHPLMDPATGMPHAPMAPVLHPMTGEPMQDAEGQPMQEPDLANAPDPTERMVHQEGNQFTDDPQQAAYDWRPDLTSRVLSGRHVRLLPHTAETVWDAYGVMIADYVPWGALTASFPDLLTLPREQQEAIKGYRPQGSDDLLPKHRRNARTSGDHALCFVLVTCYRESAEFPDGYYGIAIGGRWMGHRQPWVSYVTGQREALLLPVSQVKLFRNGRRDPAGDGLMDDLGSMSEVMAAQIGSLLEYLDLFNHPTVYLPLHSTIQDEDVLAHKPIVRFLPGGEPVFPTVPRYPPESMSVFEAMKQGAQEAAHIPATAQGVEDPNVQSGRHAYQIIAQAHAQLSEPLQNVTRAYVRCSQIELQYARAFQLDGDATWTGEDGEFKAKRWEGADLRGDVRLQPGTMTMLSPAAKAELTEQWMQVGILSPDEGRDMIAQGVGAVVGLRDNPFRLEVRRQIAQWEEGPPAGWQPFDPMAAIQQQGQQAGADPMMIQQAQQNVASGLAPAPVDPMQETLWAPRPHHSLPGVAQMRVTELAKVMAGAKYHGQPRPWQAALDQEFQRCAQLAAQGMAPQPGAPTPAEGSNGAQNGAQDAGGPSAAPPSPAPQPQGPPEANAPGFDAQQAHQPALDNPAL